MEPAEYQKHFDLEESHWWFRGRRRILLALLPFLPNADRSRVWLDAGCGTGFNMKAFEPYGRVFGCDYSTDALFFCQKRGLSNLVRADVQSLPYKTSAFDVVSLLDVLYHKKITDDIAVLREANRLLKAEGILLITDSAFEFLRSAHDRAVHARERYRKKQLKIRLETAGFEAVRMSYFNFVLFPLVVLVRLAERQAERITDTRRAVQSDLRPVPAALNAVLSAILGFEASIVKKKNLPWGSSIVCLARKKPNN